MTSGEGMGAPSIAAGVSSMLHAANSGGFAVSANAGQQLLAAITDMKNTITEYQSHLTTIDQEPQLGTSPGATVTKPFVRQVANGDDHSFIPVLKQFGESLDQAAEAITKAMANYRNTESHQTSSAHRLG